MVCTAAISKDVDEHVLKILNRKRAVPYKAKQIVFW